MPTYTIHIRGQVQGVGFRPHVYRLARQFRLRGTVSNGVDGVRIKLHGPEKAVRAFQYALHNCPPKRATILSNCMQQIPNETFPDFRIIPSNAEGEPDLLITPDLGICDDCRSELQDPANRRHQYAFTTCIHCGPRYSIMEALPYDRETTTMESFAMCPACEQEYNDPLNRRFYSQTNSCPDCPVHLFLVNKENQLLSENQKEIIQQCIALLQKGAIIGVKGIGGYLLMTDATQARAVQLLRQRKHRPGKPFALMYPDADTLERDVYLSTEAKDAFTSIESPIVLAPLRPQPASGIALETIAPGLGHIGAMQPYTPFFELLMQAWGKPIVATSGNLSGSPIYYEDEKAIENLGRLVDYFVTNDRRIVLPQDDSVIRFSPQHGQRILLRRSRGYAPTLVQQKPIHLNDTWLALGAELKSSFAFFHAGNTYVSQYLGDMENFDTQESFRHTLQHLTGLLKAQPAGLVADLHPDYFSHRLAQEQAEEMGIPLITVQHHLAHFAAVLAENEVLDAPEPILGFIWDGTGLGTDDQIWGGECFLYKKGTFERLDHLHYFRHWLGDKMSREPRLSALSILSEIPGGPELIRQQFSKQEWTLYGKMLTKPAELQTSSMGRLFDAVAAVLDIMPVSSFEGEAAMQLESLGLSYYATDPRDPESYLSEDQLDPQQLLRGVCKDHVAGLPKAEIAYRFHYSLADYVLRKMNKEDIQQAAFSGGVFQNALLTDLLIDMAGKDHTLYFHQQLSPNDECISYGQLALMQLKNSQKNPNLKETQYTNLPSLKFRQAGPHSHSNSR